MIKKKVSDEYVGEGIMPEELMDINPKHSFISPEEKEKLKLIKAKVLFKNKIPAHISSLRNGQKKFYNGNIIEVDPDYIFIEDRVVGKVMLGMVEIHDIDFLRNKPRGDDD